MRGVLLGLPIPIIVCSMSSTSFKGKTCLSPSLPITESHPEEHNKSSLPPGRVLMGTYTSPSPRNWRTGMPKGPNFIAFHLLTEKQYGELFETVDILAERIRQLGRSVPLDATGEFVVKGTLNNNDVRQATKQLIELHEAGSEKAKSAADLADKAGDIGTNDIFVDCREIPRQGSLDAAGFALRRLT